MKKAYIRQWLAAAVLGIMAVGCMEDQGNYDYQPGEKISISGIESGYIKLSAVDRITLNPTVTCSDPDADLEYFWTISPVKSAGVATPIEEADTICRTKAIDHLVSEQSGNWALIFCAKNKKSGYAQYATSSIDVTTPFSRGWFVLKDDGSQADIDLYTTSLSSINILGPKLDNAFSTINGRKLDGKGLLFQFHEAYKTFASGGATFANTRVLTALSEADASVIYMNSFAEIMGFDEMFVVPPVVKAPGGICTSNQIISLTNNGQVYCGFFMQGGLTRYGAARTTVSGAPYRMSKYFLCGYPFGGSFFFDEMSSSFFYSQQSNTLGAATDGSGTQISAINNGKILAYMGYLNSTVSGYAIFLNKSDQSKKTLSKITASGGMSLVMTSEPLTTASKLYNGSVFGMLGNSAEVMYVVVNGNEIWSRDLINKTETQQLALPAGEEITFIRHRAYTPTTPASEVVFAYDYVMVGSKSGSNYKVRMFPRVSASSGDLNPTPGLTLEGTGIPRDVIYVSSSSTMNKSTYSNTY